MAVTYPYTLNAFADHLKIAEVEWSIQRNDELSGSGNGDVWAAELADPKWTGDVRLEIDNHNEAKQVAALVRKLHGAQHSFMLFDPLSRYPQYDPTGSILGGAAVTVGNVGANRNSMSINGLPASYRITLGDKFQINWTTPTQTYFGEFSESVTAGGGGNTGQIEVFPHVPPGISAGASVILIKPAAKVFIMPESHSPGRARGLYTDGQGFRVMERRR